MRVFTWEEIVTGKVPRKESFDLVADYAIASIMPCDSIYGAILCGSFLGRNHSLASDIDVFLVYARQDVDLVMETLGMIAQMADSFSVPVEFITVSDEFSTTPFNPIGPLLRAHIQWAADHSGLVKGNPLDYVAISTRTVIEELVQYLSFRITWLEKKTAEYKALSPEKQARVLSKVLDPYHVARKVLQTMGFDMAHGPKAAVIERYQVSIDSRYLRSLFLILHEHAKRYSELIEYYVKNPVYHEYRKAVTELESLLPVALAYLHESARFILSHPRFGISSSVYDTVLSD